MGLQQTLRKLSGQSARQQAWREAFAGFAQSVDGQLVWPQKAWWRCSARVTFVRTGVAATVNYDDSVFVPGVCTVVLSVAAGLWPGGWLAVFTPPCERFFSAARMRYYRVATVETGVSAFDEALQVRCGAAKAGRLVRADPDQVAGAREQAKALLTPAVQQSLLEWRGFCPTTGVAQVLSSVYLSANVDGAPVPGWLDQLYQRGGQVVDALTAAASA